MAGNNINNNNRGHEMIGTYKECRRNHALSVGGHAVDGCREFAPGGPDGTEQALLCQACGCHRSFHRHELLINIRNLPLPAAPAAGAAARPPLPPLPPHGVPLPPPPAHPVQAAHMVPFVPVMVLHRAVNPQIPPRPPLHPQPENADGEIDFEHKPSVQVYRMRRHPF